MKFTLNKSIFFLFIISTLSFAQDITPPLTPTNFKGYGGDDIVRLYWDANTESDLAQYVIYKGTVKYGYLYTLSQMNKADTSYFDYDVSIGTTYYYVISAFDSSGNESLRTPQMANGITPIPNSPISWNSINNDNELIIAIDPSTHQDYGFALPVTYELRYTQGKTPNTILYRYSALDNYTQFDIKTDNDFFNNIYVARIDSINSVVYVSIGFSSKTDSIFVHLLDSNGNSIVPTFNGISPYYDNRLAVVTASADDWHQWGDTPFNQTVNNFRQYKIPITVGLITDGTTNYSIEPKMIADTWQSIQNQLDLGYVEVASHSRNHFYPPEYPDIEYEVNGSKEDIINNLSLPANYTNGDREYVYIWIAPGGGYSAATERMVGQSKYLGTRGYTPGKSNITKWNPNINLFDIFGFTVEIGDVPWGGETDPTNLSNQFDTVINEGGVYHIMCHPSHIAEDWDSKPYLRNHMLYISGRTDIWYTTLGHLYLYNRLFSSSQYVLNTVNDIVIPQEINIAQNYPNPFNPRTTIQYNILNDSKVNIVIFDLMGKEVMTLVKEYKQAGQHTINWNGRNNLGQSVSAGIYFYKLQAGDFIQTRKMVLLK